MNDKFYNAVAARANDAYLSSIQSTLNYLIGCIVEKVIYIALYDDKYTLYKGINDVEILQLIEDIRKIPEITKYNLLTIYANLTHISIADKSDLFLDLTLTAMKDEASNVQEYLRAEFPFIYNTYFLNFSSNKTNIEDKVIICDIFNRILKICFCNEKTHHLGNIKNRLYQQIKPDELLFIGEESVMSSDFTSFKENYVKLDESKLDISKVLSPLVECLENNYDVFGLKVLDLN